MAASLRAVFFDVDGVLIDSLPQHLQICRDEAVQFDLALAIPTVDEFRGLVRQGVKVSPMREFFLAVGFPETFADRATADYDQYFMARYRPSAFPDIEVMVATLARAGFQLGLVTSNIRANVAPALAQVLGHFDPRCLFFFDRYHEPRSKSWCLQEGARILGLIPSECLYVGDQPADAEAASRAGMQFLGVTYGWGISEEDRQYDLADSVTEISDKLCYSCLHNP